MKRNIEIFTVAPKQTSSGGSARRGSCDEATLGGLRGRGGHHRQAHRGGRQAVKFRIGSNLRQKVGMSRLGKCGRMRWNRLGESDAGMCDQAVLTIAMVSLSETKDGVVSTVCWQYVLRVFIMGIRM